MLSRVLSRLTLAAALLLGAGVCALGPYGVKAVRLLAGQDDPAQLADIAVRARLDPEAAARYIEAALSSGDIGLAESFVELAAEHGLALDTTLLARVKSESSAASSLAGTAARFAAGFVTGEPKDIAGFAGTVTGDLFVFGDLRDIARETAHAARGEDADEFVLGLAALGLIVTAGTYASLGMATPARAGFSLLKAAGKAGHISLPLRHALARSTAGAFDRRAVEAVFSRAAVVQPAATARRIGEAVRPERFRGMLAFAGDVGTIQAKAGTRGAIDAMRLAHSPKDMTRVARLAEAKGGKTRAILKIAGRGAFILAFGLWNLASWIFTVLLGLLGLCWSLKRLTERATLRVIHWQKARRSATAATPA
jgi:hypothetical protein